MKKLIFFILIPVLIPAFAQAHFFWVNSFESNAHKPPHTMVSLGWGHVLPIDDVLVSPSGKIAIESFDLFDPSMIKIHLGKPHLDTVKKNISSNNVDIYPADLAVQKIALKKNSTRGVYQISASSVPTVFTQYIDKKGRPRWKDKSMDQLDDIDKVLQSVKYQAFAKSYITLGEWVTPEPLDHGLEIISNTDLSNIHSGDMVQVKVLFYGKPLNATADSNDYIFAASGNFGMAEGFYLMSFIKNGKAQFRVQSGGQWIINVFHMEKVTKEGPLKELMGKTNHVMHAATLTFNVK